MTRTHEHSPQQVDLRSSSQQQSPSIAGSQNCSRRYSPYQLRSWSQRSQNEAEEKEDRGQHGVIKFNMEVRLKDTVNQRLEKARNLSTYNVECNSWNEVYRTLWQRYSRHFENLVLCNRDNELPEWTICENDPTIEEFSKRFSLRLDTKQLKTFQSEMFRAFILKNANETFMLSVYKYGTAIVSNPDLIQYEAQCLRPSEVDRAGAASEAQIQDIIETLKSEWATLISAQEISWRLWAVVIARAKKPVHQRLAMIKQGPPTNLLDGFSAVSNSAEALELV
ncbi:hypothetical protein AC1031_015190 [Aphanomyces cochlioides]|nr:hypothetical protein AC1031_015190 [Aphanomyces cochlioides]